MSGNTLADDAVVLPHDAVELYRLYGPYVLRRGLRFMPRADAEELVHDVFVKLLEDRATFTNARSQAAWLLRVATRLALNRRRDERRQGELLLEHAPTAFARCELPGSAEARVFLGSLWRELDEELAMIGVLYYVDGLTTAEIGAMLGVSDRTVANRLTALAQRARAAAGDTQAGPKAGR